MAERNLQLIRRMLDSEIEQGQTFPPAHIFLGSTNDITDSNIQPILSASGSTTNIGSHQLSRHHNTSIFYQNQHYNLQQYHMIPTPHFADAAPSYHNSYMIPSSTGRIFPRPPNHGPYARPYGIFPWPPNAGRPAHRPFSSNYGVVRNVRGGLLEGGSAVGQVYEDPMYNNNFAMPFHPSIGHNYQPPATDSVRGLHYGFHPELPAPSYRHSMGNNLHHNTVNNSHEDQDFTFGHQAHVSSTRDLFYRPPQGAPQSTRGEINALIRFLPSEEVAIVEFRSIDDLSYEDSESSDMETVDDIYEELLALEERIGHVNTGLTEDTISKCLRTRTHTSFTLSSSVDQSREIEQENPICVICQAEYEENEKLGCLECGHEYHVDCIKQWLLLKNTCPLCKNQAFSLDNEE